MDAKLAEALKDYIDVTGDVLYYLMKYYTHDDPDVKEVIEKAREKKKALDALLFVDGNPPWRI